MYRGDYLQWAVLIGLVLWTSQAAWAVPGDTNKDGAFTVADVQCVVLVATNIGGDPATGSPCLKEPDLADLDCSGDTNVVDIQLAAALALGSLNEKPGLSIAVDVDRDNVHDNCDINPGYFDPLQQDRDTLDALACENGDITKWSASEHAWICAVDLNTKLTEEEVDAMVANNGYLTVDTKLTEEEVDAMVANNGYSSVDTKLTEEEVDAMVANNGYLSAAQGNTTIAAKPFWGRSIAGNTNEGVWVTIASLEPLKEGNYLTPTEISLKGYGTHPSYSANFRYVFVYADGTTYNGGAYSTNHTNGYIQLYSSEIATHPSMRSSIVRIDLEAGSYSESWHTAVGYLEVTGFETPPNAEHNIKPFPTQSIAGSNNTGQWTVISSLLPNKEGNYLSPTKITLKGYSTHPSYHATFRYTFTYADGTSYSPGSHSTNHSSGYITLEDRLIPTHPSMRSSITRIDLEATSYSESWHTAVGMLEVEGYETPP